MAAMVPTVAGTAMDVDTEATEGMAGTADMEDMADTVDTVDMEDTAGPTTAVVTTTEDVGTEGATPTTKRETGDETTRHNTNGWWRDVVK